MHTPSTPKVSQPLSATDPRYSTSGIFNAQLKEKNRQGLMSTYSGRTGQNMDINKFANAKIESRDPRALPALEYLAQLYKTVGENANKPGVGNSNTSSKGKAMNNAAEYNKSVDAVNNYLAQYNINDSSLTKANYIHNSDKRAFHSSNFGSKNKNQIMDGLYGATNKDAISKGSTNTVENFNQVAEQAKKQSKKTTGK